MQDMNYVFRHFFTHKDRLVDPSQLPGTMLTPLSYVVIGAAFICALLGACWLSRHRDRIRKVFTVNWAIFAVLEVIVALYDTYAANVHVFDYALALSLYPCSLYLYMMPVWLWSKNRWWRWMAGAYFCTLGLVGASINLFYPAGQLITYSAVSFMGLHSITYHANILFVIMTLLITGEWRYNRIDRARYLLLASVPTILLSIPANILNYSPIKADYMYFTGKFILLQILFPDAPRPAITLFMYFLYIGIPPFFFLPSYISQKLKKKKGIEEPGADLEYCAVSEQELA